MPLSSAQGCAQPEFRPVLLQIILIKHFSSHACVCSAATALQVIFRNVHKLLVDTASSEFLFCLDFWEDEGVFKELFGPVVSVVETDLATQLQVTCLHGGKWLPADAERQSSSGTSLGPHGCFNHDTSGPA